MTATTSDPAWQQRVRREFDAQAFMHPLRAHPLAIEPGHVTITCGHDPTLTQQHGFATELCAVATVTLAAVPRPRPRPASAS
jgi:hypothetical protein